MSVRIVKDVTPAFFKAIMALAKDRVLVGIPAENAYREPDAQDPHPEINNAEIGYLNEFGLPEMNIPPRPHLVPGVQKALDKISGHYRKGALSALNGDKSAIAIAENKVGVTAMTSVQATIDEGIAPPLAAKTLAKRRAKGRTGTVPLIDKGDYRQHISYVIQPAKDVKNKGKSR